MSEGLTVLYSSKEIPEVKAGLFLAEGFLSWHLHHSPEHTQTRTHTYIHY